MNYNDPETAVGSGSSSSSTLKGFARPSLPILSRSTREENDREIENIPHISSSSFPYTEPVWSNSPKYSYHFQVLKNGVQYDQLQIPSNKTFLLIGRVPLCDIQLDHPSISRFHAILQFGNPEVTLQATHQHSTENDDKSTELLVNSADIFLYDIKSVHGTFLNKRQLEPYIYTKIQFGDFIRFGASSRTYILHAQDQAIEEAYYENISQKRTSLLSLNKTPLVESSPGLNVSNPTKVLVDFLIEAFGLEKVEFTLTGQQLVVLSIHPKDHLPENLNDILLLEEVVSKDADGLKNAKNVLSSKILNILHESGFDPSGKFEKKGRSVGKEQRASQLAQEEDEYYDRTKIVKKQKIPELKNSADIYESVKGLLLAKAWQISDKIGIAIPVDSECNDLKAWTVWLNSINTHIHSMDVSLKEKIINDVSEITALVKEWEVLEINNTELQNSGASTNSSENSPMAPSVPVKSFRISIPGREKKPTTKVMLSTSPLAKSTTLPFPDGNTGNSDNDTCTNSVDWLPPS